MENTTPYSRLCALINIQPINQTRNLIEFCDQNVFHDISINERIALSLQVLLEMVLEDKTYQGKINKTLVDHYISQIDELIEKQLNIILHHQKFQALESRWRGLKYLSDRVDYNANVKVEVLDIGQDEMRDDFNDVESITETALYKHIYIDEYDTPGGEPISVLVSDYTFDSSKNDILLLENIGKVTSLTHCPFIGTVTPKFFYKESIEEVVNITDLTHYLERAEYIPWRAFRNTEYSKYVALTLPRFLLRLPYGVDNPIRSLNFEEESLNFNDYLWGTASFAFAANIANSFKKYGWCVNIRGAESGGKVEGLPVPLYETKGIFETKIPTECIIPETRELELSNLGFIPLSYYKNSDYACFFSANSCHAVSNYYDEAVQANQRINSKLPYLLLTSRLAHYFKVIQRESIGTNRSQDELESNLNQWLQKLVTKMNNPGPELSSTHPLRDGTVKVEKIPDNPGFYKVFIQVLPHFQIEGIDARLSLVAQIPALANKER